MNAEWLREANGKATLRLHIQPGAKTTMICGVHGDALKIKLAAPPVDGKANDALLAFIADLLGIAKSSVCLKSGHTSRRKVLELNSPPTDLSQRLLPAAPDEQNEA